MVRPLRRYDEIACYLINAYADTKKKIKYNSSLIIQ